MPKGVGFLTASHSLLYQSIPMSHIYLILSDTKLDQISKERFLKFSPINHSSDLYGYYRYDEGLCLPLANDCYRPDDKLSNLLSRYKKASENLFFTRFLLTHNHNENDAFTLALKAITKKNFTSINVLDGDLCMQLGVIYKIMSNTKR